MTIGPYAEQQLADMTADDFDALVARVRPPDEPTDPKERAAAALRRDRGLDRRRPATKEAAVEAWRGYFG
ncbi:hypothetical protein NM962_12600 [Mycobacterium sp. SVM_VP21]|nr:hypothetical protein NM962_12600 [Mycobacterium sp. SVM_VP21]